MFAEVAKDFPQYRCHKEVRAVKIREIHPGRADGAGPGATLIGEGSETISVPDVWMGKYDPQPGGYFVVYEDGYQSFSPAKAFEDGYSRL